MNSKPEVSREACILQQDQRYAAPFSTFDWLPRRWRTLAYPVMRRLSCLLKDESTQTE